MQRPSVVFEMPDLTKPDEVVSEAEMEFFCEYGFLVKKALLDPDKLELALDLIWAHLLAKVPVKPGSTWSLSRDDKQTWNDPEWAEMSPHPVDGPFQGRHPIEYMRRVVKLHDLGSENYVLDLLPNDPRVREVAKTILSGDLRASTRIRGVYIVFPSESVSDELEDQGRFLGPHTDQVCQQLNACGYLEDVNPRNGGFTLYPGSHKSMFRAHQYEANWSPLSSFRNTLKEVAETIEPYEIVAEKAVSSFGTDALCILLAFILVPISGGHCLPISCRTSRFCRMKNTKTSISSNGSKTRSSFGRTSPPATICGGAGV